MTIDKRSNRQCKGESTTCHGWFWHRSWLQDKRWWWTKYNSDHNRLVGEHSTQQGADGSTSSPRWTQGKKAYVSHPAWADALPAPLIPPLHWGKHCTLVLLHKLVTVRSDGFMDVTFPCYSNKPFCKLVRSADRCDLLHSRGPVWLNWFSSLKKLLQAKSAIWFILKNIMSQMSKITLNLK